MKVPPENKDPAGIHNATIKIQQRWYYALLTHDLSQVTQYGLLQYHYLTKKLCSTLRAKRASNIFEVFPENLVPVVLVLRCRKKFSNLWQSTQPASKSMDFDVFRRPSSRL